MQNSFRNFYQPPDRGGRGKKVDALSMEFTQGQNNADYLRMLRQLTRRIAGIGRRIVGIFLGNFSDFGEWRFGFFPEWVGWRKVKNDLIMCLALSLPTARPSPDLIRRPQQVWGSLRSPTSRLPPVAHVRRSSFVSVGIYSLSFSILI